jgi:hypothetical protein
MVAMEIGVCEEAELTAFHTFLLTAFVLCVYTPRQHPE